MSATMPASQRPLVLVIDDDEGVRKTCVELLKARGHDTLAAASVGEGLRLFASRHPAAVILDLKLPDGTGVDVLRALQRLVPGIPVIVISGYGSVAEAVEAMKAGAAEFIEKPLARDRLFAVVDRVLRVAPLLSEADLEKVADGSRYGMIGRSEAMRRIYQLVEMAAPTKCRVFVSGESGTGKELIARAIHALSPRRDRPFAELNCAAIPLDLIESEMFGHVKGAFTGAVADRAGTFEAADGGTLLLDEVGDMSLMTQARLLRVLQEGEITRVGSTQRRAVDVRILAATSKNLHEQIAQGAFREDLFHRINVLTIAVPPLSARREDIPDLAEHFLRLASVENGLRPRRLAAGGIDFLVQLPWKGNVRELRNTMERIAVLASRDVISQKELMELLQIARDPPGAGTGPLPLREARARFERQYILDRLSANQGNLGSTARDLGIERTNLYRKMRQLGISKRTARPPD
jgi:two-component system, NtrC family, nitrogen regulation response regulator NtrX